MWKEYFPEHPDGFPRNTHKFQRPTEVSGVEKYTTLWRHQTIDSIKASIRYDRQQAEWRRNKAAELRASTQELPELDTSNHPELVEFRRVFPQYPSGITAISSPRNTPPPATSEVKTLDLAHCIEVNKTSMATQWAIDAPKEKTTEELPREYARHHKVFSEDGARRFPPSRVDDHEIKIKPGAPTTIPGKTYPLNPIEMEAAKEWISENEQLGYIERGDSPWATPFFFVKKSDGKLQPVQDYRKVNEWTIPDTYPLPRIETILEQLSGKQLFTTLDIRWGYNNIRIRPEDRWKAAFITPFGLYLPNVMPFGLRNAPGTFQRCMHTTFRDLLNQYPDNIHIYMDDFLIATPNRTPADLALHRMIVHKVLQRFEDESFFLKAAKCHFEKPRVNYLGIVVENGKIHLDPTKQRGLLEWPTEQSSVSGVRSTLGVFGYHRPFIPGFAEVARPLTDLLKKNTPFKWGDEERNAVKRLIALVEKDMALNRPDHDRPFELEVDASQFATGAILFQRTPDGLPHPISYYSHALTPAERGYDVHDRELLAVMLGLRRWHHILLGARYPVKVYTDHKNLQYYRHPRDINRRVARYLPELAEYNLVLIHKPGVTMKADHLSRRPDLDQGQGDNKQQIVLPSQLFANVAALSLSPPSVWEERLLASQRARPMDIATWTAPYGLSRAASGLWTRQGKIVVVANNTLRREVVAENHDHITAGHPGISKTLYAVQQTYWWPDMKQFITQYVKGCPQCQETKAGTTKPKVPIYPITTKPNAQPFETIALDLIVDLPLSHGYDSILTITDHDCTKAAVFLPCTQKIDSEGVAALYAQHVFPYFGIPRRVISDRDTRFTSKFTTALCKRLSIDQNLSTAYHPQTDGQAERTNQWLEQYLRIYSNFQQNDWATWLPVAQYVHNTWPSSTTGFTPSDLLIGFTPRIRENPLERTNIPALEDRATHLKTLREQAQGAIRKAQLLLQKHSERKKGQRTFKPFKLGQQVWLEGTNLPLSHPIKKLRPK
jgi:RNase H-like domain found in reverse transcriptase/Reverse transcriptase (RNA-dependent DNA polymerase)/Integrase zinc binding domain